jgi:hypothetical protein
MQPKKPIPLIGVFFYSISVIIFITAILKATNLLTGEIPRRENSTMEYSMVMGSFSGDFTDLTKYLNKDIPPHSRILWLPLNFANYIIIPDSANSQRVFLGTSFFRDTIYQLDYPGFFNFGWQNHSIKMSMMAGNFIPLCRAIRENNINYLIINNYLHNNAFRDRFKTFFTYERLFDIYEPQQTPGFLKTFLGNKIASFGKGFDLYRIHPNLQSEKIEVYGGETRLDPSNKKDWCSDQDMGKLISTYSFDSNTGTYTINANIVNAKKIFIIIAENLGYRYRLETEGLLAEQVESIEYKQVGPQFVAEINFKKSTSGVYIGRIASNSLLEKNIKLILFIQVSLLVAALVFVIFKKKIFVRV